VGWKISGFKHTPQMYWPRSELCTHIGNLQFRNLRVLYRHGGKNVMEAACGGVTTPMRNRSEVTNLCGTRAAQQFSPDIQCGFAGPEILDLRPACVRPQKV
jgi:hypothetical protein